MSDRVVTARPYGLLGLVLSCVLIVVAAVLVCSVVAAAMFGLVVLTLGLPATMTHIRDIHPSNVSDPTFIKLNIVAGLAIYLGLIGMILAAAWVRGGTGWRDLVAWRAWHPFRGSRLFWILLAGTLVYSLGADWLVTQFHPEAQDWVPTPNGPIWDVLFVALAALLAPIAEELMFRGWIYTSLRASIGVWMALLVSSALFALAHWESTHLYALVIFPIGLVLGTVRERTGTIAASIGFHALYNAFASALLIAR